MKTLILFAVWMPDNSENSRRWVGWYRQLIRERFLNHDIFITVNHGSHQQGYECFLDVPDLVGIEWVPQHLHVDSDAAGFQLGLTRCRDIVGSYDYVLFLHTKGISYDFAAYDPLRPAIANTLFNHDVVSAHMNGPVPLMICYRGHLADSRNSIVECGKFARSIGIDTPIFNFGAGMTLFYAHAPTVAELLEQLPSAFFSENLIAMGHNRFFFEGTFPSLLAMKGLIPVFIEGAEINPKLNPCVCYDCEPTHNSAVVIREFGRRLRERAAYQQLPVPFLSCANEDLYKTRVFFAV